MHRRAPSALVAQNTTMPDQSGGGRGRLRLLIAGRASVARAIMQALPQDYAREEGYYRLAGRTEGRDEHLIQHITWCGGHLLEWAPPEDYDPEYRSWRLEHLPILPARSALRGWKTIERPGSAAQLEVIRRLLAQADEVIHAGDPDREGQWMVDEVLHYLHREMPERKMLAHAATIKRLLIDDLNPRTIRESLQQLQDNTLFESVSASAQARSQADWLYGLNMTRTYTLLGRHAGYEGVLSVGRVQTPVLGLVVHRDEAIENFHPEPFVELQGLFTRQHDGSQLRMTMTETCSLTESEAQALKFSGKTGVVVSRDDETLTEPPPLPHDLSSLQIECSKRFGYSSREVMDACQQLYEKHHLISYPRSDSRYLPEKYFDRASETLDAISRVSSQLGLGLDELVRKTDCWIKQRVWKDAKSRLHHAIIPALRQHEVSTLDDIEKNIYAEIARTYIYQFMPDTVSVSSRLVIEIDGFHFEYSSRKLNAGAIAWQPMDTVFCADVSVVHKKTRPVDRFTEASLMEAMSNIAPFVNDTAVKLLLKENDGLGTESTRTLIIENLVKRGYLIQAGRSLFSAPIARDLIHALPPESVSVDVTALWEKRLQRIASGHDTVSDFMEALENRLIDIVSKARQQKVMAVTSTDEILGLQREEKFECPRCHSILVRREGKRGSFWGCSSYPECKMTVPDFTNVRGESAPDFMALNHEAPDTRKTFILVGKNCPDCGKPLVKRHGKRGAFAGCSAFPACKHTEVLLHQ